MLTAARSIVQVTVLLGILVIPLFSFGVTLYQVYGPRGGHMARLSGGLWHGALFQVVDAGAERFGSLVALADRTKGAPWSVTLFGYQMSDPLAFVGHLAASKRAHASLLLSVLLPLAGIMLLGRVFCGWMCPYNSLGEAADVLRRLLRRHLGVPLPDVQLSRRLKYGILALVGSVSLFPLFLPYVLIGREVFTAISFGVLSLGSGIVLGLLLIEVFMARRLWCRSLCPSGALMGLLGRFNLLHVSKPSRPCPSGCSTCHIHCPMALSPNDGFRVAECIQCGLCVNRCPQELLQLRFGRRRAPAAVPGKRSGRALAAGGLAAAVFLLGTASAGAHHVRGLPHYGYAENYPQVPTKEVRGVAGEYDFNIASYFFEGLRRQKSDTPNDMQLYVWLRHTRTGQSYRGPLTLRVMEGEETLATYERQAPDEEVVYKIRYAYGGSHRFTLAVEARDDGNTHHGQVVIPIGEGAWTTYYLAVAGLLFLGIGAAALRTGRLRRRRLPRG